MNRLKRIRENGIPLRWLHIAVIILTTIMAFFLLIETFRFSSILADLSSATDDYIELQKDANELMNASDYLTQEVQNFTVTGEKIHLLRYFEESEGYRHRDNALKKVRALMGKSKAYEHLNRAMKDSVELMEREYYAMKLTVVACEIEYIPKEIENVTLSREDEALSKEKKLELARQIVHNTAYHLKKDSIRTNMEKCLDEIESQTRAVHKQADSTARSKLNAIRIVIFVQLLAIVLILLMSTLLIIVPMIKGVYSIKKDEQLPVRGSYEFRYLARTYNKMYDAFKKSIESLNYDASHDKLTGIYNRAGYDVLKKSIDLKNTAVLMIDADNFKNINDSYGHAVGDRILCKVAKVLKKTFRSEDYVCRIGGDEFVVFMLHVTRELSDLITFKAKQINKALSDTSDSLPPISTSIGVAFGEGEENTKTLLKHADEALYKAKENGRNGCCFYEACGQPIQ